MTATKEIITLPSWPQARLIREACAHWNLKHEDQLDPDTGDWATVYNAVLAFLRHSITGYDSALNEGADRDELRERIKEKARMQYQWLRLSHDPRTKTIRDSFGPRRVYNDFSKKLSELLTKKDLLVRSRQELKRQYHPDYKQRLETIDTEIRELETDIATLLQRFQIGKPSPDGKVPSDLHKLSGTYLFGGRILPPNYIKALPFKCPECNATVFGTKRPLDQGAGIKLMAFSCLCVGIGVAEGHLPPTEKGWAGILECLHSDKGWSEHNTAGT